MIMTLWISIISTATALVAVIVGPIMSYIIAKRQISASTVTMSRQQWINTLRNAIADFSAKASMTYCLAKNRQANEQSFQRIEEMVQLNYKIELLINPHEEDHAELAQLAEGIASILKLAKFNDPATTSNLDDKQKKLIALSQQILKREWERVKLGEH